MINQTKIHRRDMEGKQGKNKVDAVLEMAKHGHTVVSVLLLVLL